MTTKWINKEIFKEENFSTKLTEEQVPLKEGLESS